MANEDREGLLVYIRYPGDFLEERSYSQLLRAGGDMLNFSDRTFPYKGSDVLIVQARHIKHGKPDIFGFVPGRIRSIEGNNFYVEPIMDLEERSELEKLLKEELKGPIRFWDRD